VFHTNAVERAERGHAFVSPIPLTGIAAGPHLQEVEGRSERDPAVTVTRRVPIRIQ
jgi:hypothetical protein